MTGLDIATGSTGLGVTSGSTVLGGSGGVLAFGSIMVKESLEFLSVELLESDSANAELTIRLLEKNRITIVRTFFFI